ncbi:MAG: arsenate reductase (glutaredoxin) [Gammaproteobacteria bacterium]|nr:arsenate reductase (glutaredoxin) [Gammaproteobacteria bacterium]
MTITLYHNPRCSKSRATLKLLDEHGVSANVVDYQKTPPTHVELQELLKLLGMTPRELMRTQEPAYREANLDDPQLTDDQLINAIIADPILLQRPIVVAHGKAAVGRPPENVLDIL